MLAPLFADVGPDAPSGGDYAWLVVLAVMFLVGVAMTVVVIRRNRRPPDPPDT